jgi:YihY family inner membrane protein
METPEDIQAVQSMMETIFPTMGAMITPNLIEVSHQNTFANVLGTILLAWSTYELFTGLETIFAKISTKGSNRNFYLSHLAAVISFIIVFGSGCLFMVISTASQTTFAAMFQLHFEHFPMRLLQPLLTSLSLLCVVGSLTLIYKLMPTQKIALTNALRGSFLFLLFFTFGRSFFQFYVEFYKTMNASVYGTFLTAMVMIVWIYYIAAIFLFAAQYVIYLEDSEAQPPSTAAE